MNSDHLRAALLIPVAAILFIPLGSNGGLPTRLGSIGVELLIGLPCWLMCRPQDRGRFFPLPPLPGASLLPLLSLAIGLQGVYGLLDRLWPVPFEQARRMAEAYRVGSGLEELLLVLGVLVLAPLMEELYFRGCLFRWLEGGRGTFFAVAASALVFALLHLDPWLFAALFLLGLLLALLRVVTRSLWPAIVVHAANNGIALLALQRPDHPLLDWVHSMGAGGLRTPLLLGIPGFFWLLMHLRESRR